MNKNKDYLITEKPSRALFAFALPMIIGNLFQQAYNIVDSAIVGHYVGETALAAVGASYALTSIFICVAIGGGISAAEALLPAIQAELDWLFERCTVMPTVKPELVRCRYGNDANLIGALKLFFEQNPA